MNNVEDYLFILMIFKQNEDRVKEALTESREEMRAQFEKMSELEQRIDLTLDGSVTRILTDGAQSIGRNMGEQIAQNAKSTLTSYKEHHFLRGQVLVVWMVTLLSTIAYALGAAFGFGDPAQNVVELILKLPTGFTVLFVCGAFYAMLWSCDYWWQIQSKALYKTRFVAQILVLVALLFYVLTIIP